MANRKNLEGKLWAIQELKAQKYIGTKEAWNYLDRVSALYENPKIIAGSINEELIERDSVYYRATPERIMGLSEVFDDIFFSEDFYSPELNSEILFYDNYISGKTKERDPKKIANYLYPVFKDIQNPDTTDRDFGFYIIEYSLDKSDFSKKEKEDFYEKSITYDFYHAFSSENLRNIEKREELYIFFDELDIGKRIKRMHGDLVDHRLENRREILCDYLVSFNYGKVYLNGEELELNYENLREFLMNGLKNKKKRLEELKDIKSSLAEKEYKERAVKETEFLLTAMAPEKNFINKYLRS